MVSEGIQRTCSVENTRQDKRGNAEKLFSRNTDKTSEGIKRKCSVENLSSWATSSDKSNFIFTIKSDDTRDQRVTIG